jgi:hypothetical protein
MRALLVISILFLILLAVGVLHYSSSPNDVTITIDKQKGREKAGQVIEKSKELGSKIAEEVKDLDRSQSSPPPTPTARH